MTVYYPTVINTIQDSSLTAWTTQGNLVGADLNQVKTVTPLTSVSVNLAGSTSSKDANPPATVEIRDEIRYMRTQQLRVTGFGVNITGTVVGCEIEIQGQRYNRCADWDIRLVHAGDKIGDNQRIKIELNDRDQPNYIRNTETYGSSTSTWGADLSAAVINDPTFGVSIELVSHPITPHRDTPSIDSVSLRVYTL